MEKANLPLFYQLGIQFHPLTQLSVRDDNMGAIVEASFAAERAAQSVLNAFPSLAVCRVPGRELLTAIQDARDKLFTPDNVHNLEKPGARTKAQFQRIIGRAKEFETVLLAELQTLTTYHVTQKGVYSMPDLIERAEEVLPSSVLQRVGPEVKGEMRQGGRCLAFDNGTAAIFHVMRATELVLHEYYVCVCSPNPAEKLPSWGAYISKLQKSEDAGVKEVLAMVQQIKDQHRNLVMHPEVSLSPDEAFVVFEIAKGAIIAMVARLPENKGD